METEHVVVVSKDGIFVGEFVVQISSPGSHPSFLLISELMNDHVVLLDARDLEECDPFVFAKTGESSYTLGAAIAVVALKKSRVRTVLKCSPEAVGSLSGV